MGKKNYLQSGDSRTCGGHKFYQQRTASYLHVILMRGVAVYKDRKNGTSSHTRSQQQNTWKNSVGACTPDPPPFNSSHTLNSVQSFRHFTVNSHLEGCCVSYHVAVSQSLKCSNKIPALAGIMFRMERASIYR